jgi:hypothetical protein
MWLLVATPCHAQVALNPASSFTQLSGDDFNTSTLYMNANGTPQQMTYCPWVIPSLTGAGFTGNTGWNFTWATAAQDQQVLNDLTVVSYYAWAVNAPVYTDPNGQAWGGQPNGEAGGAYLQLAFNPGATDPVRGQTITWIQAVDSGYYGGALNVHLDNPNNRASPFYITPSYSAGQNYFVDIPGTPENEYEGSPVGDFQAQVFLAVDSGAGGGFTDNVTIYGGEWWGYQYTAVDTPEPGVASMFGLGLGSLLFGYRRLACKRAGQ